MFFLWRMIEDPTSVTSFRMLFILKRTHYNAEWPLPSVTVLLCVYCQHVWIIFPPVYLTWSVEAWERHAVQRISINTINIPVACSVLWPTTVLRHDTHVFKCIGHCSGGKARAVTTVFLQAAIHQLFFFPPRDSWVIVLFRFSDVLFLPVSVPLHSVRTCPVLVHGRWPLKRVSPISLYSCFVG